MIAILVEARGMRKTVVGQFEFFPRLRRKKMATSVPTETPPLIRKLGIGGSRTVSGRNIIKNATMAIMDSSFMLGSAFFVQ
jgi:hypothetical protein